MSEFKKETPPEIDIVIFVVNDNEEKAISDVFSFNNEPISEENVNYKWTLMQSNSEEKLVIAMISLNDTQGEINAYAETKKVIHGLNPTYIFNIGTAGGIRRDDEKIEVGDLIISSFVHYGTVKMKPAGSTIRNIRISQPNEKLHNTAIKTYNQDKWKNKNIHFKEIISGDILHQDEKIDLFQTIKDDYPRASAVEMESGGIAKAVHEELCESKRIGGYLTIKGISDIVTSETDNIQEVIRHESGEEVSRKSASFLKDLIKNIEKIRTKPIPHKRVTTNFVNDGIVYNDCLSGIYYNVKPKIYSKIAIECLMWGKSGFDNKRIFLSCTFSPRRLFEIVEAEFDKLNPGSRFSELEIQDKIKYGQYILPHFVEFNKITNDFEVSRILLLNDKEQKNQLEIRTVEEWEIFKELNGNVKCYIAFRDDLIQDGITFLTDYVVIGDRMIFEYYDSSQMLLFSDLHFASTIKTNFTSLSEIFYSQQENNLSLHFKNLEYIDKLVEGNNEIG